MLPKFELLNFESIKEASAYARKNAGQASFYAGGTDLFVAMLEGNVRIPFLVSLRDLPQLQGINILADGSLSIGAAVTFNEIVKHEHIKENYPHFPQAMSRIGSYQVRNLATIGGNLCSAVPSADSAPPLLVSNASLLISDGQKEWELPLCEFFLGPRKTALKPGELVTRILVPAANANDRAAFIKRGQRKSMTISTVSAACRLGIVDGVIGDCAVALGSVAPTPIRAQLAEKALAGQKPTKDVFAKAAAIAAAEDCRPIDDVRSSAAYRRSMVQTLVNRVLLLAAESK